MSEFIQLLIHYLNMRRSSPVLTESEEHRLYNDSGGEDTSELSSLHESVSCYFCERFMR